MTMANLRQRTHLPAVGGEPYRGIEAQFVYNGLVLNDRRSVDRFVINEVTGIDDADVRDAREDNPEADGESAFNSFYSGRTITLRGEIRAGNISRLREMQSDLKRAFNPLNESNIDIIYNDIYDSFYGLTRFPTVGYDLFSAEPSVYENKLYSPTSASYPFWASNKQWYNAVSEFEFSTPRFHHGFEFGPAVKVLDSGNYLFFTITYSTTLRTTNLWVYKKDLGTNTLLTSTSLTTSLSPNTKYVASIKIVGDIVTAMLYTEGKETLLGSVSYTLTGANATKFGSIVRGKADVGFFYQGYGGVVKNGSFEDR